MKNPLPPVRVSRQAAMMKFMSCTTVWSKATVTNNISLRSLKIAKNGLTQWFLESFYAAVLVFWCLKMIRCKKSCISLFCQNGGLASARLNPAWTEPSNNPQRLPSSFNITKYHQNTPRLSLRHPKTSPNSIRHYRHHRISSKTFKVVYLVHQYIIYEELNEGGAILPF